MLVENARSGKIQPSMAVNPERMIFCDPSSRRSHRLRWLARFLGISSGLLGALFLSSLVRTPSTPPIARISHLPRALEPAAKARPSNPERGAVRPPPFDRKTAGGAHSFSASATPSAPRVVAAFYAPWQETGLHSLRAHANALTHIMPEWLHLNPAGTGVDFHDWDPSVEPSNLSVVQLAREHGLKITPIFNNDDGTRFDPARTHRLLREVRLQRRLALQLRSWLVANGFHGVNIDFESMYPQDYARIPAFLALLRSVLQPAGLEVSIDIEAGNKFLNWNATAAACDFVVLMAYDEHDSSGEPGPIASLRWYQEVLDLALRKIPPERLVVGIGNYAYDWAGGNPPAKSLTYQQAMYAAREYRRGENPQDIVVFDQVSRNPTFTYMDESGTSHEVWMLDAVTAANQVRLASPGGVRGAAMWLLGSEDPSIWQVLRRDRLHEKAETKALETIHVPYHIEFIGEGEVLSVATTPQEGIRRMTLDGTSDIFLEEKYELFPSSYVIKRSGLRPRVVALTFDDGPAPKFTAQVLDELKRFGVRATFFVTGSNAVRHPDLLRQIWTDGHEIGNHTFTHPVMAPVSTARAHLELNATQRVIQSVLGRSTLLFRPPYKADAEPATEAEILPLLTASRLGYLTVGEFIDPRDWETNVQIPGRGAKPLEAHEIVQAVLRDVEAGRGSIVLLHDGGGDRSQTVAALAPIVSSLQRKGYRFTTVSELIGSTRDAVMPQVSAEEMAFVGAGRIVFGTSHRASQFLSVAFISAIALGLARPLFLAVLALLARRRERKLAGDRSCCATVSVLIAAYNEERVIGCSVATVLGSGYQPIEVIVVDDGSRDQTAETLQRLFPGHPRVRVFRRPHQGKAAALNFAMGRARGEILLSLDADTLVAPDAILRLVRHFADAGVGAVAGNVKVGNRRGLLTRWQAIEYITSQNMDRRGHALFNAVTVVPGAIGAWRREAVLQLGGYQEDTLAEDTDLTWRLRKAGWRVEVDNEALGFTEAPETLRSLFRQRFRWTFGTLQCLWKHRDALGRYGWFGWVLLPSLWLFQIALQTLAPLVDLQVLWALGGALLSYFARFSMPQNEYPLFHETHSLYLIGLMYGLFSLAELGGALIAVRLDRERVRLLWCLLLQRFVYRQLMYLVLMKSLLTALAGIPARWRKAERMATARLGTIADCGLRNAD